MKIFGLWAMLVACLAGCASTQYDHSVPNLVQVESSTLRPAVWRSGQPRTLAGWKYLESLGIKHVLKLDFVDEGDDSAAAAFGMTVVYLPIEPTTKAGFMDVVEDVFATPDAETLAKIEATLASIKAAHGFEGGWLIHCFNGHDRTGLVVGMLRVIADGWDKHHAWSEMLDRGYHPELVGLDRAFHEFTAAPRATSTSPLGSQTLSKEK